jgi:hypothetical protein
MHVIEIKQVSQFSTAKQRKNGGEKMKGCSTMLLKTNGENMSESRLSTMLMKTNDLQSAFHDVDEKKESYWKTWVTG